MMATKWICTKNKAHVFDRKPLSPLCPYCKKLGDLGMVLEDTSKPEPVPAELAEGSTEKNVVPALPVQKKEAGLCVLVMDASHSMLTPAFAGSPLSRLKLVAETAAYGVFDLQRMRNNPNAFVSIIMFDDRVKTVFPEGVVSIASLIERFDADPEKFALFLEEELGKMNQGTDINAALDEAYWLVNSFINEELPAIFEGHYLPVQQTILKFASIDSVSIPNVRVLMYTDGMQYDSHKSSKLLPNPFLAHPIKGLNHDVLIGAYFGNANENGALQLSSMVSNCPVHNIPQYFLIDTPFKIESLRSLFRMASGASGFCPKCLDLTR